MKMRDTIAIGWLDPGLVDGMFALCVAQLYAERNARIGALLRVENAGLISRGRNELAHIFLETTDCQWLLMLDSDMQLGITGLDKLLDAAHDTERPLVAGLYFGAWPGEHFPQPVPLIFKAQPHGVRFNAILDYPDDELIPVDSAGTGCLLIHRSVLEKLRTDANAHQGNRWCWFQDMPINGDWFSEDHWFCARAKEMGYQLYAHTGVVLPHRKKFWMSDKQYVKPNRPQEATSDAVSELRQQPGSANKVPGLRVRDDGEAAGARDDGTQAANT